MSGPPNWKAAQRRFVMAQLVADDEPPMCFVANAKWLRQEIPPNGTAERRAAHASAINAWMIIETMRVNRRIARDVKGQP